MKKTVVHVVGTGTIGEPLIGLFTDFREKMGIDEVTFHKRSPLAGDRSKLNHLMARGAKLAAAQSAAGAFADLLNLREGGDRAAVRDDASACPPTARASLRRWRAAATPQP